jgi:hypothetical protein
MKLVASFAAAVVTAITIVDVQSAAAQGAIDNTALSSTTFREHKRTFGLVYTLPKDVNDTLNATVYGLLREKLLNAKLYDEAQRFNMPHVTVLHIHNPDPATPEKMLKALPKLPGELKLTLKNFYTTEAAKGAGHPWWLDLGIAKEGPSFEAMMVFNTAAVPPLTALRDGPLPRVTGPVYAVMAEGGKELVRTVGVSGVNTVKDGKELRPAQSAQHAGLFDGEVHAGDPGGLRPDRQGVQPDPARRHSGHVQDGIDRRTGFRRQRVARDLPYRPR